MSQNVVLLPPEPPISLSIPFGSIETMRGALDMVADASKLVRLVISRAPVVGEAAALTAARKVIAASCCVLAGDSQPDPEHVAAVLAGFTEQIAERHGEESGRAAASLLQALLEQAQAAD